METERTVIERLARIETKLEGLDGVPETLALLREALASQSPLGAQVRQLDEEVKEIRQELRDQNRKLVWIIVGLVLGMGGSGAGILARLI